MAASWPSNVFLKRTEPLYDGWYGTSVWARREFPSKVTGTAARALLGLDNTG